MYRKVNNSREVYDSIKIGRVDRLRGEARAIAEENNIDGLVIVKQRIGDDGLEIVVEPVVGTPTEYLREQARREGLDLNRIMDNAFGTIKRR